MREIKGNIWKFEQDYDIVITTNGTVKSNGEAVMGAGIAAQAAQMQPHLPKKLGTLLKSNGNHVHYLGGKLYSFPVKHDWWEYADINLIVRSALELVKLTLGHDRIYLTRVGCGNGKLTWTQVKPAIECYLDDRFIICDFKGD